MFLFIFAMLAFCRDVDNYYDPGYRVYKCYLAMLGLAKRGRIKATGVFEAGNLKAICSRSHEHTANQKSL